MMPAVSRTVLIATIMLTSCQFSSDIDRTETWQEGSALYISGHLNAQTVREVGRALDGPIPVDRLVLVDIEGSQDDAANLKLGRLVHNRNLDTFVPAGSRVSSGGVDLFCAGRERTVEQGAELGVHSWRDGAGTEGRDLGRDDALHADYLAYFEEVGCPVSRLLVFA